MDEWIYEPNTVSHILYMVSLDERQILLSDEWMNEWIYKPNTVSTTLNIVSEANFIIWWMNEWIYEPRANIVSTTQYT